GPCENLVALSRGADALITECGLLPGEASSPAWPHLSPEMAAEAAKAAGCRQLYLTHFAANKYDSTDMRKAAGAAARRIFPPTQTAYDGMEVHI
ncbi:MAG: ribonuclease Z, partial [Candidatus Micrarchaeota archaeon]|nr:ribonuclease Z [Candidatus Micrarchaeota archaeon]